MATKTAQKTFQQFIYEAIASLLGDVAVYRNGYSGRGMMGRSCFAITGSWHQCQQVMSAALKIQADELIEEAIDSDDDTGEFIKVHDMQSGLHLSIDTLMNFSFDQMGHDVVIYWKTVPHMEDIK